MPLDPLVDDLLNDLSVHDGEGGLVDAAVGALRGFGDLLHVRLGVGHLLQKTENQ